jgi:alpha-L-fucosidase
MRKTIQLILLLTISLSLFSQEFKSKEERLEWWKDLRFGMSIHWGPVSLKGTEIGWSRGKEVPTDEYDSLYRQFDPVEFNAVEWVRLAKAAGMQYVVFTSKHHDGFCMWDTKYNEYNIMNSPFKRDVMKELAEACKKEGMALGYYYSVCDWRHPDFPVTSPGGTVKRDVSDLDRYTGYLKNQSVEIIRKYGPLVGIWYDMPQQFDSVRGQGVIDHIRKVQPDILVNNRTGAKGDFDTPEQRLGNFQPDRPWETWITLGRQWAWKQDDEVKTAEQCIHSLIRSAGGDGNLLLNIGPRSDGAIEPLQIERLKEVGQWMKKYGFTVYGTRGGPFKPTDWGVSTRKGNLIYLHILRWSGNSSEIILPDIGKEIKRCTIVGGEHVKFAKKDNATILSFNSSLLQPVSTIIEIELAGSAMDIGFKDLEPLSASYLKSATASSNSKGKWVGVEWIDIKSVTNGDWSGSFWKAAVDDKTPWVEIDLGSPQKIKTIALYESGQGIKSFELQVKTGEEWKTFYNGTTIGEKKVIDLNPIEMKTFRLLITSFNSVPGIYEIILLK